MSWHRQHYFFISDVENFPPLYNYDSEGNSLYGNDEFDELWKEGRFTFKSFWVRSDNIGRELTNAFEKIGKNFNLDFLDYNHWIKSSLTKEIDENSLTFNHIRQQNVIQGIDDFFEHFIEIQVNDEYTEKPISEMLKGSKLGLKSILKDINFFDEEFNSQYFVDECDFDNPYDFYNFMVSVQYLFQYSFDRNKFVCYKTWY